MSSFRSKQAKELQMPLILGVSAIVAVVIFVMFLLKPDQSEINARLKEMEEKLAAVKILEQQVTQIENRINRLELLHDRIERIEESIIMSNEQMEKSLSELFEKINKTDIKPAPAQPAPASRPAGKPAVKKPQPKLTPKAKKAVLHKVLEGDTLYSISRKHRITVVQLRKYNKLGVADPIHVGQKLVVRP